MSASDTRPRVFVDGRVIVDPAPNGWGTPGPFVNTLSLAAGRHVVALEAQRRDADAVKAAVLVRARFADGRTVRFDGARLRAATTQNSTGWARITVKGRPGQAVTPRYAELLNTDGSVDQTNLREARATDIYTIRGTGSESYEPRFTYHGFRYVQVEGLGAPLRAGQVVGVPIRSDLPETGDLTLGGYVPQRLWINSRWSQRSNFIGIPTDCPQRDEGHRRAGPMRGSRCGRDYSRDIIYVNVMLLYKMRAFYCITVTVIDPDPTWY